MYGIVQSLADQKLKEVLKLGDGSELTGEWDEAKVVRAGCDPPQATRSLQHGVAR